MRRWAILWKSDLGLLIYGSTREGIEEGVGCSGGKIKVLTGAHEQRLQLRLQCGGRKGSDWLAGCWLKHSPRDDPPASEWEMPDLPLFPAEGRGSEAEETGHQVRPTHPPGSIQTQLLPQQ